MNDVTPRNEHEDRIRQVVANQMAIHDDLEKLRDDYARIRRERDLLVQQRDHVAADLQMVKAERDHYMVQVATFLEQFSNTSTRLLELADGFRKAAEQAVSAPFKARAIEKPSE